MPSVDTQTQIDCDPDRAFAAVRDFERYAALTEAVRSVTFAPGEQRSTWEVRFQEGTLRWTEHDEIDAVARVIRFGLVDGDFEQLAGTWSVVATASGCCVRFSASFDFGIPTLARLIDPLACKTLTANVHEILDGLFAGHVVVHAAAAVESVA